MEGSQEPGEGGSLPHRLGTGSDRTQEAEVTS